MLFGKLLMTKFSHQQSQQTKALCAPPVLTLSHDFHHYKDWLLWYSCESDLSQQKPGKSIREENLASHLVFPWGMPVASGQPGVGRWLIRDTILKKNEVVAEAQSFQKKKKKSPFGPFRFPPKLMLSCHLSPKWKLLYNEAKLRYGKWGSWSEFLG